MDSPYKRELEIAELAVQRAALLTKTVLATVDKGAKVKSDDSPVTVADFGAQALLISAIKHNFPGDSFIGEETADVLRENQQLQERVWELVSRAWIENADSEMRLSRVESKDDMLDAIDLGGHGSVSQKGRTWVLDPIDGTATFMSGHQYAVCLALLEDGHQKVGVLGCPNLRLKSGKIEETWVDKEGYGLMLSAVKDFGAYVRPISNSLLPPPQRIENKEPVSDFTKLDFVESRWASVRRDWHGMIAGRIGAHWPGTELYSQQMKYVSLALGASDVMLRMPRSRDRWTCVWDHAGGQLIYEETGGKITDMDGNPIDFKTGRKISQNYGMVAAHARIQQQILQKVQELMRELEEASL